jgi:hypothetical protein
VRRLPGNSRCTSSYSDHQRTFDAGQANGLHQCWKSEFLPGLSEGFLDTFRNQAVEVA